MLSGSNLIQHGFVPHFGPCEGTHKCSMVSSLKANLRNNFVVMFAYDYDVVN